MNNLKNIGIVMPIGLLISLIIFYYLGGITGGNEYRVKNYLVYFEDQEYAGDLIVDESKKEAFLSKVDLGFVNQEIFVQINLEEYPGEEEEIYLGFNNPTFRVIEMYRISQEGKILLQGKKGTGIKDSNYLKNPNPVFTVNRSEENFTSDVIFK